MTGSRYRPIIFTGSSIIKTTSTSGASNTVEVIPTRTGNTSVSIGTSRTIAGTGNTGILRIVQEKTSSAGSADCSVGAAGAVGSNTTTFDTFTTAKVVASHTLKGFQGSIAAGSP